MKLNDVIKDCITLKLDGSATDGAIQVLGGNFLSEQKPVLPIEVRDKETLLWMMQGADDVHIYVASGVLHINALYKPAEMSHEGILARRTTDLGAKLIDFLSEPLELK